MHVNGSRVWGVRVSRFKVRRRLTLCQLAGFSMYSKNSCVILSMILRFGIACNFTLETSPHLLSWRFVILDIIGDNI